MVLDRLANSIFFLSFRLAQNLKPQILPGERDKKIKTIICLFIFLFQFLTLFFHLLHLISSTSSSKLFLRFHVKFLHKNKGEQEQVAICIDQHGGHANLILLLLFVSYCKKTRNGFQQLEWITEVCNSLKRSDRRQFYEVYFTGKVKEHVVCFSYLRSRGNAFCRLSCIGWKLDFWTDMENSIRKAYKLTDEKILEKAVELGRGGSTSVTAILIDGIQLVVANIGDSRAVICKNGEAKQLSVDHEPNSERKSIGEKGGFVSNFPGDVLVSHPKSKSTKRTYSF